MFTSRQSPLAPHHTALLCALVFFSGCASFGSSPSLAPASGQVITQDEVPFAQAASAYDVIQRLRPTFLVSQRDPAFVGDRQVYINGMRAGGMEALRSISADRIQEIRLLPAGEATRLLGAGHGAGALMIRVRRW